ncbi:MAG: apolipoprotein N-acyltransferase, partial [Betaproteobacteria bacterium]|nr:apolipoprotein N-acyltransferase [Betaproteobacteria bacterium]
ISGQSFGTLQGLSLACLGALLLQAASQETELTPFTNAHRPDRKGPKAWVKGFKIAGLFATAAMTATWAWLYVSMHQYGGLPSWLACLALVLLAMALATYFAIAGGVWVGLYRRWLLHARHEEGRYATQAQSLLRKSEFNLAMAGAVLFAALWTLAELARGQWFTGGRMKVRLLQGNIPQDEKFIPGQGVQMALSWYGEQLLSNTEVLVVTPETAIPVLPQQLSPAYWQTLNHKYQTPSVASGQAMPGQLALVGLPMGGANVGYSNSVLALGPDASKYRYDKQHLVPFGEFVPPFFQWFVRMMNMPLGDFAQQPAKAGVLTWQGQRLLPQICYEDLFGEEVAKYFANADQAPTVLVNMSNLAWFGNTTAPAQHAAISQLRALEFQRPVIRATNTGLTALIDDKGVVKASLPVFTRGALVGEFEGRTGLTPYAQWTSQWGLWPLWLLCGAIVLVLGAFFRRVRSQAI